MFQRNPDLPRRPLRMVVETDDPALAFADFVGFGLDGFDVAVCGGPADGEPCPACEGDGCPLVEAADVVFNVLRDESVQRAVVEGIHATAPGTPMVVMGLPGAELDLPPGCTTLAPLTSLNGQAAALRRAATER